MRPGRWTCGYCRLLLRSYYHHKLRHCQHYPRPETRKSFSEKVCEYCGIPKKICITGSGSESCANADACEGIYRAVFDDADIRDGLFAEADILRLDLETFDQFMGWVHEEHMMEGMWYTNAWKVLETLDELNYLAFEK
ncbi:hypothetical protein TWF281_004635 [Arthrobotrys megalospora]